MQQRGLDAGPRQLGDEPVEEVELTLRVGTVHRVDTVGHRQVRPDALELQQRIRHHGRRDGVQVLGRHPHPVHSRVDLDMHGDRPAGRIGSRAEGGDPFGRIERRREPVGQCGARRRRVALAQQEHGRGHTVLAQLDTLVDERHGKTPGTAGQSGPRHRRSAVPVAVGLDDRAQLGRCDEAGQHGCVVRHCGQVDLGPCRA